MSGVVTLVPFLQVELASLASETRKKNPEIKSAIDELTTLLSAKNSNVTEIDILTVLKKTLTCGNVGKLLPHVINILHRLILHASFPYSDSNITTSLEILDSTVSLNEDMQLKALQCVMPLVTHYECHGQNMMKSLSLCVRMQAAKSPMVHNAAVAIFRQLIIWLFEKIDKQTVSDNESINEDVAFVQDAYFILEDVCHIVNGEKAQHLPLTSHHRNFTLELLESILGYHSGVFTQRESFTLLVKDRICGLALQSVLNHGKTDFPVTCRLWRVLNILVKEFNIVLGSEMEAILATMAKILLDTRAVAWERALILEGMKDLVSEYKLLAILQESFMVTDWLMAVCNTLMMTATRLEEKFKKGDQDVLTPCKTLTAKPPLLNQFEKNSPPSTNDLYILYLCFDVLSTFLSACQCNDNEDNDAVSKTLAPIWNGIFRSLMTLLKDCKVDNEWSNCILNSLSKVLVLTAKLKIPDSVDVILRGLCELAIPSYQDPSGKSPGNPMGSLLVTDLNLSASVMILKTAAIEIAEFLGPSWTHILRVLLANDQFNILKTKTPPPPPVPVSKKSGSTSPILNSPSANLDKLADIALWGGRILENSEKLSPDAFDFFLEALCNQCCQDQEENSAFASGDLALRNALLLFPTQKLKQVLMMNIHRFLLLDDHASSAWQLVTEHLLSIMLSPDPTMRGLGCDTTSLLISQYSSSISEHVDEFTSNDVLQDRLLMPLQNILLGSELIDVHKVVVESLYKVLQSLGPHFTTGWTRILEILMAALGDVEDLKRIVIHKSVFGSVRMICADYIAHLHDDFHLRSLSLILQKVASLPHELNTSLTAIALLWDVADYVRKGGASHYFMLWLDILGNLVVLGRDGRVEVRNSAIQTMTRAVEIGGTNDIPGGWEKILDQCIIPLINSTTKGAAESTKVSFASVVASSAPDTNTTETSLNTLVHHSRDTEEKQWDESQVLILQGTLLIFQKYYPVLIKLDNFDTVYWQRIMDLVREYVGTGKGELVGAAFNSLAKLCVLPSADDSCKNLAWDTWCILGAGMSETNCYNQDNLLKFVRIFPSLYRSDMDFIVKTMDVLDRALKCPTSGENIKDLEKMTELQRTVLALLDDSINYQTVPEAKPVYLARLASWMDWVQPLDDINVESIVNGDHTFVALALVVMERVQARTLEWAPDAESLKPVLESLSRLMICKYRVPMVWRLATSTFNSILPRSIGVDTSDERWSWIVQLYQQALQVCRNQVPLSLTMEQLSADESFDMEIVLFIRETLLPLMRGVEGEIVKRLLLALDCNSRLYEDDHLKGDKSSLVEVVAVAKERLAIACLHSLFLICTRQDNEIESNNVIAGYCLPILLSRCRTIISQYMRDRQLLYRMPFPRVRQYELQYILESLNALLIPGDLPRRHLICLYKEYCELIGIRDDMEIVSLVQQAFFLIGAEMDLLDSE